MALAKTVANSPYLIDSAGFLNASFVGNTWCPDAAHGVSRMWPFLYGVLLRPGGRNVSRLLDLVMKHHVDADNRYRS